ncbi:MAG: hypothetical protein AAF488_11390 [Planctomycetota bacterium]
MLRSLALLVLSISTSVLVGDDGLPCLSDLTADTNLSRGQTVLRWQGAGGYAEIVVEKNGLLAASLSGEAREWVDTEPGDFQNQYTVFARHPGLEDCGALTASTSYPDVLVERHEEWSYFGSAESLPSDPPDAWRYVDFDDSAWERGATGIGFGDNDDYTEVLDMRDTYVALCVRHVFEVPDAGNVPGLVFRVNYDDGFVAYLNGMEVARSPNMLGLGDEVPLDMPAGGQHEAHAPEDFAIDPTVLRDGQNVLAVQVHNAHLLSGDLSFDPELLVDVCHEKLDGLLCFADPESNSVSIRWNDRGYGAYRVERNGEEIEGSPFPSGASEAIDAAPIDRDLEYVVTGLRGDLACSSSSCEIRCEKLHPDDLEVTFASTGGSVDSELRWARREGAIETEILRDGQVIATVGGDVNVWNDVNASFDNSLNAFLLYEVRTRFERRRPGLEEETCTLSSGYLPLCPTEFYCEFVEGVGVQMEWVQPADRFGTMELERDGETLAVLPGDATSFVDRTITSLEPGSALRYRLFTGTRRNPSCISFCRVLRPVEPRRFSDPDESWDYAIEFAPGDDQYVPIVSTTGLLDGNWERVSSDSWDGSAALEVDPGPLGRAPGGAGIERVEDSECGGHADVLRVLDPGEPGFGGRSFSTYPFSYVQPNNDRILFATRISDRNLLRDGVTFHARWRLTPNPPAFVGESRYGASSVVSSIAQVGVYYRDPNRNGPQGQSASLGFSLGNDPRVAATVEGFVGRDYFGVDPTKFVSLWVTIEDPEGDDRYRVRSWVGGQTEPAESWMSGDDVELDQPTLLYVGDDPGTYLAIGLTAGPGATDLQIDRMAYRRGVHVPESAVCDVPAARFRRGDVDSNGRLEITDAVRIFRHLFLGLPSPACMDAADANDDARLDITDGIRILGALFQGASPLPAPGSTECGVDVGDDDFPPCASDC